MKRTTIFPSRLATFPIAAGLVLAGLLAQASGASAQQPPAQPAAAAQPAQPSAPLPATHTVAAGETLWGLAQQFLGDPLLWPEIYRLNTTVIEDPHWIFPGEELHLIPTAQSASAAPPAAAGADSSAAASASAATGVAPAASASAATPAASAPGDITVSPTAADTDTLRAPQGPVMNPATGETIFATQGRSRISAGTLQLREARAYRAVRAGEYYSAGFLLEPGEQLESGTLLGNSATSSISRLTTTTSAMLYGTVVLTPIPNDTLKPGDLLLSYDMPRVIPGYGSVVRPTGLLKVTGVGSPADNVMAQVIAVYQTIDGGQSVMRVPPYKSSAGVRPEPVPEGAGVLGQVIDLRQPREVVNEQDLLFIDKGLSDGVHLGDIFEVSRTTTAASGIGTVVQNQGQVIIVYAREHTATGLVIQVDRPDIRPGSAVRQIRRMPS